ncbi:hypothetical protein [Streptomyces sp. MZ04]|uniref:hypothetical protein n=1 Tax=Streptomyces sp. MZ04 TaxID=2559236 RepID=UPI00107EABDA|nr:hypothetical protein [Streptomyces sp. MZ04]TGB13784.1 hypothetical protein E2651_08275 [Streptomyces sp. MZ04]
MSQNMTLSRRWAKLAVAVAVVVAAPLGALGTASPATAEAASSVVRNDGAKASDNVDGCDLAHVPGWPIGYGETDARSYKGRDLTLYTEKWPDTYAYASITGDVARYDKVYVQRSLGDFNMHSKPRHPSDDYVRAVGGGVMTCRFTATWADAAANFAMTGSVRLQTGEDNRSHAVRACVKPTGAKFKCTRWFIDHY